MPKPSGLEKERTAVTDFATHDDSTTSPAAPVVAYDEADWVLPDEAGTLRSLTNEDLPYENDAPFNEDDEFSGDDPQAEALSALPQRVPSYEVVRELNSVLAAAQGRPASELRALISQIRASSLVLAELPEGIRYVYTGALEALEFEVACVSASALIDFADVPGLVNNDADVAELVGNILQTALSGKAAQKPAASFRALAERIQGSHARRRYLEAVATIDTLAPASVKLAAHEKLIPPTTQISVVRTSGTVSAAELVERHLAQSSDTLAVCHSSGLRTLDLALTAPGEPLHFIAPGEQVVIAGATGTGKSSMMVTLARSAAQDEINWGFDETPVIIAHTEEESLIKIRNLGILPGQRWHHLARKVHVTMIGSSRKRLTEMVYDLVINAVIRSQSSGRAVTDFLPKIGFLDYIQSVTETGESEYEANNTTAELVLRGFQAFNPEEIAKFSGLDFRTYAGMPWPEGIEDHRMAWVVFAQLKKPDDENSLYYKRNSSKHPLSDFTLEDMSDTPQWTDPVTGGKYAWPVRENDYRIFKKNQIKGSSKILDNASNIILLHRSRPTNNPSSPAPGPDGRFHLMDTRARLIFDKTRNGSQVLYAPLEFDVSPTGGAQFFDDKAEKALAEGRFKITEASHEVGDPMLPLRPAPSPLSGTRY
jgi:energy-coupling factor transporter ATP-binding protein EcfA2